MGMSVEKISNELLSAYLSDSEVRVRFAETDKAGIVYYANYFVWFEVGRMGYFRSLGLGFKDFETRGITLAIVKASCDYHSPAYFDDLLSIRTHVVNVGRTSMTMNCDVIRKSDEKLLADGSTVHVFMDMKGNPVPVPPWLVDNILAKGRATASEKKKQS